MNEGLPDFVGEDPVGWIVTAQRFFHEQKIHSSDKVQWAFMRMEGIAMLWFHSWCQENLDADWETFAIALMRRFGRRNYGGVVKEQPKESGLLPISSEQSNQKTKATITVTPLVTEVIIERTEFPNESMVEFDVAAKKIEVDCTRVSVTKNYTMVIDTLLSSGSPVKALPKPKPPDRDASWNEDVISTKLPPHPSELLSDPPEPPYSDSVVTVLPQSKPNDSDQLAPTLPWREPPPKPPDLSNSVDKEREGKLRVVKRRNMRLTLGEPSSKSSEPPYAGDNSIHEHGGIISEGEKVLEKLRAKWTICELNTIFPKPDAQISTIHSTQLQLVTRVVIRSAHIFLSLSCVTHWISLTTY
jgi:hypothetical protein